LSVAKLKLSDFLQDHRRLAINKGKPVKGEVIIEMFKKEIEDDHTNKPRTKLYKQETLIALKKSWPELFSADIGKITQKDCREWAARYSQEYSATRFNGALGVVACLPGRRTRRFAAPLPLAVQRRTQSRKRAGLTGTPADFNSFTSWPLLQPLRCSASNRSRAGSNTSATLLRFFGGWRSANCASFLSNAA